MNPLLRAVKIILSYVTFQALIHYYDEKIYEVKEAKEYHIDRIGIPPKGKDIEEILHNYQSVDKTNNIHFQKATKYRAKEQHLVQIWYFARTLQQLYYLVLIILVVYILVVSFPNLGTSIKIDYYVALSQIYPIFLIAFYLGSAKKDGFQGSSRLEVIRLRHVSKRLIGTISILLGVVASLAVLAIGTSSTMLFSINCVAIVFVVKSILENVKED